MEQDQQDRDREPAEAWEDLAIGDKDEWAAIDLDQAPGENVFVQHVEQQSRINEESPVINRPAQNVGQG